LSAFIATGRNASPLEFSNVATLVASVVDDVAVLLAYGAAIVNSGFDIRAINLLAILKSGSALNLGSQLASADRRRCRRKSRHRRRARRWRRGGSRRRRRSGSGRWGCGTRLDTEVVLTVGLADEAIGHGSIDDDGGLVADLVASANADSLTDGDGGIFRAVLLAFRELLIEEREEIKGVGSTGRGGGPSTLEGGHDTTAGADVINGVAVLEVDGTTVLGTLGGDLGTRDLDTIDLSLAGGLDVDVAAGASAELVLILSLADEAVGHGGLDDDGGLVALLDTGVHLINLANADGLAGAKVSLATGDKINQILGSTRRSASSLELGDVATGLTDVADGVAVLGLESGTVLRGVGRDLSAGNLTSIGKGGKALGLNINVATGLDAKLILIHTTADEAGSGHFGIDLDFGFVA